MSSLKQIVSNSFEFPFVLKTLYRVCSLPSRTHITFQITALHHASVQPSGNVSGGRIIEQMVTTGSVLHDIDNNEHFYIEKITFFEMNSTSR